MLSGNCPVGPCGVIDAGIAQSDNYHHSKTKMVVFYSLSYAFDLISGSKLRENIDPNNYFEIKMGHPFISGRIHTAATRTTHCHLRRGNW